MWFNVLVKTHLFCVYLGYQWNIVRMSYKLVIYIFYRSYACIKCSWNMLLDIDIISLVTLLMTLCVMITLTTLGIIHKRVSFVDVIWRYRVCWIWDRFYLNTKCPHNIFVIIAVQRCVWCLKQKKNKCSSATTKTLVISFILLPNTIQINPFSSFRAHSSSSLLRNCVLCYFAWSTTICYKHTHTRRIRLFKPSALSMGLLYSFF